MPTDEKKELPASDEDASVWLEKNVKSRTFPYWLALDQLPRVTFAGGTAVPIKPLLALLAATKEPQIQIAEQLWPRLDRSSMARLAYFLADAWNQANGTRTHGWMLDALADWGDESGILLIGEMCRSWHQKGRAARSIPALRVLEQNGSDAALSLLDDLANTWKSQAYRDRARAAFVAIALKREVSVDDLSDQVVPTLGFSQAGERTISFGSREFQVKLRSATEWEIRDQNGKQYRSLPRGNDKDDPDQVARATDWLKQTRKRLKSLASQQQLRFERAMIDGRQWAAGRWLSVILAHPILRYVAQQIVWRRKQSSGDASALFRVAEDFTLADANDDECNLTDDETISIPHPLELSDEAIEHWRTVLSDYRIEPAFEQLDRACLTLAEHEQVPRAITKYVGVVVDSRQLKGHLRRVGWNTGPVADAGMFSCHIRELGAKPFTAILIHDDVFIGNDFMMEPTPVPLEQLVFLSGSVPKESLQRLPRLEVMPIKDVDAVVISEVLRDIDRLAKSGERTSGQET